MNNERLHADELADQIIGDDPRPLNLAFPISIDYGRHRVRKAQEEFTDPLQDDLFQTEYYINYHQTQLLEWQAKRAQIMDKRRGLTKT